MAAVLTMPPVAKGQRLQQVSRIVLLAGRYVSRVEQSFADFARTTPPHADTFRGAPIDVRVTMSLSSDSSSSPKREEVLKSHANERVAELRVRLAELFRAKAEDITISCAEKELDSGLDSKFVGSLSSVDLSPVELSVVKKAGASSSSSTSTALVLFQEMPDSQAGTSAATTSASSFSANRRALSFSDEKEKCLPGVIMASTDVFKMLYHLADLNDTEVLTALRQLLCLIPTDPSVSEVFDAVTYHSRSNATQFASAASASPKVSPRKPLFPSVAGASASSPGANPLSPEGTPLAANLEEARQEAGRLLDASAEGMNAFRLLYNLEVLSSRLMPSAENSFYSAQQSRQFCSDFLDAGGVGLVFRVLERDALPADVNVHTRLNVYLVALQLADFLLCSDVSSSDRDKKQTASPTIKPTPPKRSALDNSAPGSSGKSAGGAGGSVAIGIIREMPEAEFVEIATSLVRVAWAVASGNAPLSSTSILKAHSSDTRLYAIRRSRDNSTGSSGSSEGAEALGGVASPTAAAAPVARNVVSPAEARIACRAFDLLVTALTARANVLSALQSLPLFTDFIVDIVLGSTSEDVREAACRQLLRLSRARVVARALNLDEGSPKAPPPTPKQFLTRTVLKTPVPLW